MVVIMDNNFILIVIIVIIALFLLVLGVFYANKIKRQNDIAQNNAINHNLQVSRKNKTKNDTPQNDISPSKSSSITQLRDDIEVLQDELKALQSKYKSQLKELKSTPEIISGQFFSIDYVDASGDKTRRKITVTDLNFNERGDMFIDAICHLRHEKRSFRLDRVEQFYNDNNKAITKDEFLAALGVE